MIRERGGMMGVHFVIFHLNADGTAALSPTTTTRARLEGGPWENHLHHSSRRNEGIPHLARLLFCAEVPRARASCEAFLCPLSGLEACFGENHLSGNRADRQ